MSRRASFVLKILLSAAALGYVFSRIDLPKTLTLLAASDPLWLLGALVLFNLSKIASSIRLNLFFRSLGLKLEEIRALKLYYIGMFYNLFLPGGIGGDGYKIYLLNRHRGQKVRELVAATLLDRVSGLAPLLLFAGILYLLSRFHMRYPLIDALDWIGLILLVPVTWGLYRFVFPRFLPIFGISMLWGVLTQGLQLLSAWMLVHALGLQHDTVEVLTLFLLSSVAAVLPVSVGGVGIREYIFLEGFSLLGLESERGVAFALLFFLITALSSLVGLFVRHDLQRR